MFFQIIAALFVFKLVTKVSHTALRTIGSAVETRRTEPETLDYMKPNNNLTVPLDI